MKTFRLRVLDKFTERAKQAEAHGKALAALQTPKQPNHQARRRLKALNRKLAKRLTKDKTPAKVTFQPDGGVHVHLEKEKHVHGPDCDHDHDPEPVVLDVCADDNAYFQGEG